MRSGSAAACPRRDRKTDIVWQREEKGTEQWPFDDPNFAMFKGRRGFKVVAGFMLYRATTWSAFRNVVAEAADAAAVWRSLTLLAAQTFPRLPLVGYEIRPSSFKAAVNAGFEAGDKLRVWVTARD